MKVLEVSQLPDELASSNATKLLQAAIGNPVSLANLGRETLGIQIPVVHESYLLASSVQFRMITGIVMHWKQGLIGLTTASIVDDSVFRVTYRSCFAYCSVHGIRAGCTV